MEPSTSTPVSTCRHSFVGLLLLLIGLLVGAAVSYYLTIHYIAPNAAEIAEQTRLDIEEQARVSSLYIYGTVASVTEDTVVLDAYSLHNEPIQYTFGFDDATVFMTTPPDNTTQQLPLKPSELEKGARVTIRSDKEIGDGTEPLHAEEVTRF